MSGKAWAILAAAGALITAGAAFFFHEFGKWVDSIYPFDNPGEEDTEEKDQEEGDKA